MDKTKIIMRNDMKKKRQQLNFSIDNKLHLDVKGLHVREERKRNKRNGRKFNLSEFYEMIIAKGVREWRNQ